jgi:hypothetical protein
LAAKAKQNRLEGIIRKSGLPLSLLLIVCAWIAAFWYVTAGFCFAVFACFIATILIPFATISTTNFLANFRLRRERREFRSAIRALAD